MYQNKNNLNSKCADIAKDYKTLLGGITDLTKQGHYYPHP